MKEQTHGGLSSDDRCSLGFFTGSKTNSGTVAIYANHKTPRLLTTTTKREPRQAGVCWGVARPCAVAFVTHEPFVVFTVFEGVVGSPRRHERGYECSRGRGRGCGCSRGRGASPSDHERDVHRRLRHRGCRRRRRRRRRRRGVADLAIGEVELSPAVDVRPLPPRCRCRHAKRVRRRRRRRHRPVVVVVVVLTAWRVPLCGGYDRRWR